MKRNAIHVSPEELRKIANDLDKEDEEVCKGLGLKKHKNTKFLMSIINKTGASDGWEFEK